MSEFVKKIEAYFKNTPKEKLNADYKRIHSEYGHGVEFRIVYPPMYCEESAM